jgi:hypothetical protein
MPDDPTAHAILAAFISPNEPDRNLEPANFVDAVCQLARAIDRLAAATEQART